MDTSLAIYDALIQAKVPPEAAKAVVGALERDMITWLATKQDLRHATELLTVRMDALEGRMAQRFELVSQKFDAVDQKFDAVDQKFEAMESLLTYKCDALESRLVIKLGALMAVMFGIAGTLASLLR